MSGETLAERLQLDILQTLGTLQNQVGVLQAQCAHIIQSQDEAAVRRRAMYEKIDKIATIESTLDRIAPLVDAHEQKHQRSIGALWLMRGGWTVGGGAAGAGFAWLAKWMSGGGPPH
ncbi:hypothetical protein IP86_02920 [Rhodopseudomonas sp. AAP120]|uniref:hypothetical protein n=1 Tax=Rhodopseudomonas sp. AAP120 TaxID=1523430 RepID=UPI0006B90746|nr:hypothetical protein [Rhodopseudomonas sp. AAP120]KPG01779.1 hypothetical protein IP86_02920 [Rhodopseudomonas sp. AAP120]